MGCFWHMHGCKEFVLPKSNLGYWLPKLERNKARDEANIAKLKEMGWNVIVLWECEIKKNIDFLQKLSETVKLIDRS